MNQTDFENLNAAIKKCEDARVLLAEIKSTRVAISMKRLDDELSSVVDDIDSILDKNF